MWPCKICTETIESQTTGNRRFKDGARMSALTEPSSQAPATATHHECLQAFPCSKEPSR
jgi:hypothetical protein